MRPPGAERVQTMSRYVLLLTALLSTLAVACSAPAIQPGPPAWSDPAGHGVWQADDVTASTGAPPADGAALAGYAFEAQGTQHIVYAGAQNRHLLELWWNVNGWHFTDLTATARDVPVADRSAIYGYAFDGQMTQHIIFVGADGHLHEMWSDAGQWHSGDLTAATATAPPAIGPGTIAGYVSDSGGSQHVVFVGTERHIYDLSYGQTGWKSTDLTSLTGTPGPAPNGELRAYAFDSEGTRHVVFAGADGRLYELWSGVGDDWHSSDLSGVTSTPGPTSTSGNLAAYTTTATRTQHVVFTAADGRLLELWSGRTAGWHVTDLSTVALALPARRISGYAFDRQGTQHIVYVGADGRLYELWWADGWHAGNLTAATDNPPCGPDVVTGYTFEAQQTQHVVCISASDHHIHELWWGPPSGPNPQPAVR
ncbi:hypothetical protein BN977_05946 [Mycolicibacterium cosmeticum]|uniref:Uncharacterized protein n=2 Tax=Mycolicibacterium cosmeticum TaxID=258533 RepID=W9BMB4_MYCCO|nr:hypothetical protein BN977_05946 [Mycolicibacterium cosmeticum]